MSFGLFLIILSFLWLVSEIILTKVKRAKPSDIKYESTSLPVLWITIILSIAAGVYLGLHPTGHIAFYSTIISLSGIICILSGLILRWIAILTLQHQFMVEVVISTNHQLIRTGIYQYIRHPAYSGSLLSFLGLGLAFSNYLNILIIFIPICIAFLYRIKLEEKVLIAALGNDYLDYCQSTKQLIPGIF
jgi:protein-S-isoprenylcysteine O-methyltransferase Ste14